MRERTKLPKGWKRCPNCLKAFKLPDDPRAWAKKHCSDQCRQEFWQLGGASPAKLKHYLTKWLLTILPAMVADELRKIPRGLQKPHPDVLMYKWECITCRTQGTVSVLQDQTLVILHDAIQRQHLIPFDIASMGRGAISIKHLEKALPLKMERSQ